MVIDPVYSGFDYCLKVCIKVPYTIRLLPDKRLLNVLAFCFEIG